MALSRITIPPDAARDAKARELALTANLWPVETLKVPHGAFKRGDSFLVTPSGYRVSAVVCECPDYQQSHNICKHIRALCLADAQRITKPTPKIEDLWDTCKEKGCQDDPEPKSKWCWRHCLVDAF